MSSFPPPLEVQIPVDWNGKTVEAFLKTKLRFSRGLIRRLKRTVGISLDGQPVRVTHRCLGGEWLLITFVTKEQSIIPEAIPIEIVYEDPDLIVINKSAGMLVHPVHKQYSGTLANALIQHWSFKEEAAAFHPIHRLDKLTSGLVLVAKNSWAHQQLSLQLQDGSLHRLYIAVCRGRISRTSARLAYSVKDTPYQIRREVSVEGKPSITFFRVLQLFSGVSLLAVRLYSGRTHQIRVHLSHIGHPLVGDQLYGQLDPDFARPALHAIRIRFHHPRTGQFIKLTASLPVDLSSLIDKLSIIP